MEIILYDDTFVVHSLVPGKYIQEMLCAHLSTQEQETNNINLRTSKMGFKVFHGMKSSILEEKKEI